jgi:hypothetical protein
MPGVCVSLNRFPHGLATSHLEVALGYSAGCVTWQLTRHLQKTVKELQATDAGDFRCVISERVDEFRRKSQLPTDMSGKSEIS